MEKRSIWCHPHTVTYKVPAMGGTISEVVDPETGLITDSWVLNVYGADARIDIQWRSRDSNCMRVILSPSYGRKGMSSAEEFHVRLDNPGPSLSVAFCFAKCDECSSEHHIEKDARHWITESCDPSLYSGLRDVASMPTRLVLIEHVHRMAWRLLDQKKSAV